MRRGESIFKRKDGRYEGRFIKGYENGSAVYGYVYARTYNECKIKRNNKIFEFRLNANSKNKKVKSNKTLNQLIDSFLISKKNIKQSSYSRYYNLIEEHIRYEIGNIKINKLNDDFINNYIANKLKNGRKDKKGGLSCNTVYDICTLLKQIFRLNNIEINFNKVHKKIGIGKAIFKNDKEKIMRELENSSNLIDIGIELSLLLGLRESEVCGLMYSDIDIKNKVIYINHIVSRVRTFEEYKKTRLVISTPKTVNSKRVLPIPNKILNKLETIIKDSTENFYLLSGKKKYMDPRTFYNHYKMFLKKLNITTNYTYHDLRHTFATNCIELGIDYKSLMELLGHSNINTTMSIYVHPTLDNKRKFINKL